MTKSLWKSTAELPRFAPLQGDAVTDVLIIGGGMAGVLCAYMLHNAGIDYLLVEGGRIGGGVTGGTTAKITAQHGLLYHKLLKRWGTEAAGLYLEANLKAIEAFARLCDGIDCDYEKKDAYIYSLTDRRIIEREMAALDRLGYAASFAERIQLPFDIAGAVRFAGQAQFHPLKFLAHIAQGLNICESTAVRELLPHTAVYDGGQIAARRVIIATHFPILNKHGGYFVKMYQHRSYAIAVDGAPDPGGMYLEETTDGLSFRGHNGLLIIGGGDHRTGRRGECWQPMRELAAQVWPKSHERYAWAAQDCMTLDGLPYIGRYSRGTRGLYVATGFNKWGMTSSMVAATMLTDMMAGRRNPYAELYEPSRTTAKGQLAANGLAAVRGLLTPAFRRCPHMGCALKWNAAERSWDCSCHGSRFDTDGSCLDNPATGGIKPPHGRSDR